VPLKQKKSVIGNTAARRTGDAMNEQTLLNDLFQQLWRDIDNAIATDNKHDYAVIKDAARDKGRQILELVADVICERDDLLKRMRNIREIVR